MTGQLMDGKRRLKLVILITPSPPWTPSTPMCVLHCPPPTPRGKFYVVKKQFPSRSFEKSDHLQADWKDRALSLLVYCKRAVG